MNHTGVTSVRSRRQALRKRSFASLDGSDEDRAVFELHAERGDGEYRGPTEHAARLEREHALVPRARDGAARGVDGAFRQAGARVRAAIGDRVHGPVDVEEGDGLVGRVDT